MTSTVQFPYAGLLHTPVGMLPSVITPPMLGIAGAGTSLELDYATIAHGSENAKSTALGATGIWTMSPRGSLFLTVGEYDETCPVPDCSSKIMFGVGGDWQLASTRRRDAAQASFASISIRGDVGSGARQFDTRYVVLGGSVPIAWTLPASNGLLVSPYVEPGIAWTHASVSFGSANDAPVAFTGTAFRAGAGIDVRSRTAPFGFHVGANQAFTSHARVVWGGGLSIQL